MKITEVTQPLHIYRATVRVRLPDRSLTATTSIGADSLAQARALLIRIYGAGNVVSVSEIVRETSPRYPHKSPKNRPDPALHRLHGRALVPFSSVVETVKPISPQQMQAKALTDRAKKLNQQAKQMRAQQSLASAQQNLVKAQQGS